jgi:hypothetical protein
MLGAVGVVAGVVAGALCVASLPYWLPSAVVALRVRIFTRINGDEGVPVPGPLIDASRFKQVYAHPAANGRSRGAALSDLFWYWLAPGPEIHQEHLEAGPRYEEVARTTRRILAVPRQVADELASTCAARVLSSQPLRGARLVRLRDLMMPVWAEFYYELVFGEQCPRAARDLIVDNANDVVTALKCCSLRQMEKRHRLTRYLARRLAAGHVPHPLPASLSTEERALYLQGTFFNTAIVQSSEGMAHLLMALAQHQAVQARVFADLDDDEYLDNVIAETLRVYPLFGISHRITTADIALDPQTTLPRGTVLCFNHLEYHRAGFDDVERFDPDRWESLAAREANYIPFGVAANRACPAQGLAPITMRAVAREVLRRYALATSASHVRSIPNRGPCLFVSRTYDDDPRRRRVWLAYLHLRDRWEDVWRSLVQLGLGTYMVWDASRQQLCTRYFEAQDAIVAPAEADSTAAVCPVTGHSR